MTTPYHRYYDRVHYGALTLIDFDTFLDLEHATDGASAACWDGLYAFSGLGAFHPNLFDIDSEARAQPLDHPLSVAATSSAEGVLERVPPREILIGFWGEQRRPLWFGSTPTGDVVAAIFPAVAAGCCCLLRRWEAHAWRDAVETAWHKTCEDSAVVETAWHVTGEEGPAFPLYESLWIPDDEEFDAHIRRRATGVAPLNAFAFPRSPSEVPQSLRLVNGHHHAHFLYHLLNPGMPDTAPDTSPDISPSSTDSAGRVFV